MVDAVNTTPNTAASRIGAGSTMLASNFETFLTLLTSQLKNQDPLSPVDSNQFTAQLTQMAGVEQVEGLAAKPVGQPKLAEHLAAIVMPIGSAADLPWARHAAERFREAHGIEPVVAYCPRETGCLVAMNTPPARAAGDFEITHKPDSLGRVLNGGVVWPRASLRLPLGLPSVAAAGIPDDADATLVISALLHRPAGSSPGAALLADALDVDKEGFLGPRDASTTNAVSD
jgi:hypothetical protein